MPDDLTLKLNEAEDYEQTIKAILAFAAFVVHDGREPREGAEFGLGRRMLSSPGNRISPSTEVTPDLVAQKSRDYGVVAEVKKRLPKETAHWKDYIAQLRKYDDDLMGWWTEDERMPSSNAILLIHHSRSRDLVTVISAAAREDPDLVGKTSCVVEFVRSDERVQYISFRLEFGEILDSELGERLRSSVEVPFDSVLSSYPNLKYYDSEPPLSLLLTNLWLDILPDKAAECERDEDLKAHRIPVSVEELTEELQRAYGSRTLPKDSRSVEFPRSIWIRRALEALVSYGFGASVEGEHGKFEIYFRKLQGDVLERFIQLEIGKGSSIAEPKHPPGQRSLFEDLEDG